MEKKTYLRIKRFFYFLKKENALRHYLYNLKIALGDNTQSQKIVIENIISNFSHSPYCIVDFSFNWRSTPQGHIYWSNIDRKWHEFLLNRKDNITQTIFYESTIY